ncbi:MAG: BamA/TamA family outer membrane protein [Bacteroidaceae bacterium]|nr:BamA/TamA family outer membrane protein [Bacteroidaceae bacterium]
MTLCLPYFRKPLRGALLTAVVLLQLVACAPTRFIPENEYMLERVAVRADGDVSTAELSGYIRQHANSKWFSLFKVPMSVYCISGTDSTRRFNRFIQRIGEAPVVYDSVLAERGRADMEAAVRNLGYLQGSVSLQEKRKKRRAEVRYQVHTGKRYIVDAIGYRIDDPAVEELVLRDTLESLLYPGMPFDANVLNEERSRLTSLLQNTGYYRFTKSHVRFEADTTLGDQRVALTLCIPLYRATVTDTLRPHQRYAIGTVNYLTDLEPQTFKQQRAQLDSMVVRSLHFYQHRDMPLRPLFLVNKTDLRPGRLFHESDVQSTYSNLSSLSAVMGTSVTLEPSATAPDTLDAYVSVLMGKRHGVSAELEGTNSAGDFGAAVSLGYQNRNLFRRSALLSLKLRGAFEAIKGLEGYTDENYIEYSAEANLNFPEFMLPFLSRRFRRAVNAQSIASLMFDSQDRPEFHRRVLTAAWRYRWNRFDLKRQHRVDLLDLNYVFMPWISETFQREYLSDAGSRNAILRYNYENLFIMKAGYTFQYTSVPPNMQNATYGKNAFSVRASIESAGNLLYGLSHLLDGQHSDRLDAYTLFNIAYAQYVKGDFDFVKSFSFDDRNSLAVHLAVGVAYPYGNSTVLPYEKRYFSGGANSVRGWSVRGLGPGSFTGSDGKVDFIRQTGDMHLDMSAEYRTHLFWKIDGAVFVDAGNIWTLRDYEEQPGGQFRFDTFWKQIAVAYGLGIRLNFGYFILRLDGGMKAVNPAYESGRERYPIIHPRFGRDFQLHFAVGLPY